MSKLTIDEATKKFIGEMNAIPQGMISKLMSVDIDDWHEVTTPSCGNQVYCFESGEYGNIEEVKEDRYVICLQSEEIVELQEDEFEVIRENFLPMWGTMWSFGDSADDYWLEEKNGIRLMSECGFRVYYSEEFGYFFGIDGAGYDFYESHWIPLYKARGLQWHDQEQ